MSGEWWRSAWPGLPHPRRQGADPDAGHLPVDPAGGTGAVRMDSCHHPRGLFANIHSLWGFAGQASGRVRPQPLADRGDEEAATSRVWEGKLCTLPPRHKSTPSNCPRETLLQILSWLVAQLPTAKCPSAQ